MKIEIPENELEITFARSSGPGGQNVNRRETKVQVRWNINKSQILIDEEKELIRERLKSQITKEGDIIVESDETRYQPQNREIAVWRLNELVNRALKKEKKRFPTKPNKGAKERRLEEKRKKSELKQSRQKIKYY
jgi:ribosome-associated protein